MKVKEEQAKQLNNFITSYKDFLDDYDIQQLSKSILEKVYKADKKQLLNFIENNSKIFSASDVCYFIFKKSDKEFIENNYKKIIDTVFKCPIKHTSDININEYLEEDFDKNNNLIYTSDVLGVLDKLEDLYCVLSEGPTLADEFLNYIFDKLVIHKQFLLKNIEWFLVPTISNNHLWTSTNVYRFFKENNISFNSSITPTKEVLELISNETNEEQRRNFFGLSSTFFINYSCSLTKDNFIKLFYNKNKKSYFSNLYMNWNNGHIEKFDDNWSISNKREKLEILYGWIRGLNSSFSNSIHNFIPDDFLNNLVAYIMEKLNYTSVKETLEKEEQFFRRTFRILVSKFSKDDEFLYQPEIFEFAFLQSVTKTIDISTSKLLDVFKISTSDCKNNVLTIEFFNSFFDMVGNKNNNYWALQAKDVTNHIGCLFSFCSVDENKAKDLFEFIINELESIRYITNTQKFKCIDNFTKKFFKTQKISNEFLNEIEENHPEWLEHISKNNRVSKKTRTYAKLSCEI